MVYNDQTSSYVPVVTTLMTHNNTSLYYQIFIQLKVITRGKMLVRTYTSDFEKAEMSQVDNILFLCLCMHLNETVGGTSLCGWLPVVAVVSSSVFEMPNQNIGVRALCNAQIAVLPTRPTF